MTDNVRVPSAPGDRSDSGEPPRQRFGAGAQGATGNLTGEWKSFDTLADAEAFLSSLGYEDAGFCGVCR